jgi:hypothetical protein
MAEPQIHLDPASLSPVEDKLRGPLEEQLTSALQAATDRVSHDYAGEPVDTVTVKLLEQTRSTPPDRVHRSPGAPICSATRSPPICSATRSPPRSGRTLSMA